MTPPRSISQLREAINSHDPRRIADCFAYDYHCEMPLHPARDFVGSAKVQDNWSAMFSTIKGLSATVLRAATAGGEVWSEWEIRGTTPGGTAVMLRGPVIWAETDDVITWARFYLDRVGD
jgi:ketosteroid isomerase-like protein